MDVSTKVPEDIERELIRCIMFIKKNYEVLAVDIANYRIRRRDDETMDFIFSALPKDIHVIEKYFNNFYSGEKFYCNISDTGYRPLYFKGVSVVSKLIVGEDLHQHNITLFTLKGTVRPETFYFVPKYDEYDFKFVGDRYD